ncbi:C6 transcription factor [Histoplasma capsulatum H143]|uniref:C6 transcription factor n=1 Tax=Ajellomyces capsulatus (strain H143) TaxID=544712 RepID=C6HNZ3_AJECH|nr:C6 transcription factor [Histoplasma capsulatum H143]
MPQPPPLFPKLHVSTNVSEPPSATSTMAAFSRFGSSQHLVEGGTQHQIFRAKRKHVLKACDRCRCDGNQPCYRCAMYNHPCLFRERKATQTKAYSRGFVEMLESHHELVVKALQQLYTHCVNNECFPGDPIDLVDGNPCTHAILDRLGLIKQAEEAREKVEEESSSPTLCWKNLPKSSGSAGTDALSPEPVSSLELSPSSKSVSISPPELECAKSDPSTRGPNVPCPFYHGNAAVWPFQAPDVEFSHSYSSTFGTETERIMIEPSGIQTYLSIETANSFTPTGARPVGLSRSGLQVDGTYMCPHLNVPGLYHGQHDTGDIQPQCSWILGNWNR